MLDTTGNFRSDSCPTTGGNIFGKAVLDARGIFGRSRIIIYLSPCVLIYSYFLFFIFIFIFILVYIT
jgi:hypothetical protein